MLSDLGDVEFDLAGKGLPSPGSEISASADTPVPADTPAAVIERVLRSTSQKRDDVLFLRSATPLPIAVTARMNRRPLLVDAMADVFHTIPDAQNQLWDPAMAINCWQQSMGLAPASVVPEKEEGQSFDDFDLLYVQAPAPGIWDREEYTYLGPSEAPDWAIDWHAMGIEEFVGRLRKLFGRWLTVCDPTASIVLQSGFGRFRSNRNKVPLAPYLAELALEFGYRQVRQHPLEIDSPNCPVDKPALQSQHLQVFRRSER
jgi:hypothetical protein